MMFAPLARGLAVALAAFCASLAQGQALITTIPGPVGGPMVVNPVSHRAYYANPDSSISVVEGKAQVARIALPKVAASLALDTGLDRIYAWHIDDTLSEIDGNTHAVRTLATGVARLFVVDERNHRVIATTSKIGEIAVIDRAGHRSTVNVPSFPCGMAFNDRTNQLYVSHCARNAVGASVVDLGSGAVTTIPFPGATSAASVAINTATNRAYVASYDGRTLVLSIDGFTKASRVVDLGTGSARGPGLVVNSADSRVYVTWGSFFAVLDGAADTVVVKKSANDWILTMHVDEATNNVYANEYTRGLIVIDANGATSTSPMPFEFAWLDIDSATRRIYVAGPIAGVIDAGAPPIVRNNYQGMWWNPGESGWGVNLAQQGDVWFAAWFTYDELGDPTWYVMPRGERTSMAEEFEGALYQTTGPDFTFPTFSASQVSTYPIGTLRFRFSDANNGTLEAVVNGVRVTKSITRQVFASRVPFCDTNAYTSTQNYTDLWWNAPAGSESGWGLFLTHQGLEARSDNVFAVWFMYVNSRPAWFVASNVVRVPAESSGTVQVYRGTLYRTSGPPFSASPWNSAGVKQVALGTMTLVFEADQAVLTWTVGYLSGQKRLARQAFSNIRTYCR
jgi:DNA-binding beta-propeller fold protein YncE